MKVVTYVESLNELDFIFSSGVREVIISPRPLSRFGKVTLADTPSLAQECRARGIKAVLEWDILMTQKVFEHKKKDVNSLLRYFDIVRVYDVGALNFLMSKCECMIQLILEHGNHNLRSIQGWATEIGKRLDRIVLSYELDKNSIARYLSELSVPLEFYGIGPMPLSYTPRKLLGPLFNHGNDDVFVYASSEESPHKDMPVYQNEHGTFIFYMKDHSVLQHFDELSEMGLDVIRVHLTKREDKELLPQIVGLANCFNENLCDNIMKLYSKITFRGFYNKNSSTKIFHKLKNEFISKHYDYCQSGYVGEVIDVQKKKYMGIMIKTDEIVTKGALLIFRTPEGKEKRLEVHELFDSSYSPIDVAQKGRLAYMAHLGGVSTRTAVFLDR